MVTATEFDFHEFYGVYPMLVALVGTRARGRDNVMAAVWHTPLSFEPPLYAVSVSPKRATMEMIEESRAFSVNFLLYDDAPWAEQTGFTSGRDLDKFRRFGIPKAEGAVLPVPIVADAYAALECRLLEAPLFGDHHLVVGEVVAVHYSEELVKRDEEGSLVLVPSVRPALYLGKGVYGTLDPLSLRNLRG